MEELSHHAHVLGHILSEMLLFFAVAGLLVPMMQRLANLFGVSTRFLEIQTWGQTRQHQMTH